MVNARLQKEYTYCSYAIFGNNTHFLVRNTVQNPHKFHSSCMSLPVSSIIQQDNNND